MSGLFCFTGCLWCYPRMGGRRNCLQFWPNSAALDCGCLECDGLNLRQEDTDFKKRQILSGYVIYSKERNRPKEQKLTDSLKSTNISFI